MRHEDCKNWDYETHPHAKTAEEVCSHLIAELLVSPAVHFAVLSDTRPIHKLMFESVTPVDCPELAGNYRGALVPCLSTYPIYFGKAPGQHEGEKPINVDAKMTAFHATLAVALGKHDAAVAAAKKPGERAALLARLISLVAAVLTNFYDIHPYANGNGHIGRMIAWVILSKYGHPPKKLTLHKSPTGYYDLFDLFRSNKKQPLQIFLLKCVLP
jgi:fido (protein-threonine AMPylation protein)